ncbi:MULTISPECIES: HTH domain-containing protein [unclassified Staphylococcus]|uniref:helix-turn-helix transcriptional regulator n=1 Tax=unclassified Staphylococcus TaxID=91994 RepID=UPI0021D093B9|nr:MULTISPECIES: HTH domain-containing protein [unclassified Staphylococcus]UXR75965.1 HTH domain-containing protein [Staphylococcus sp. IVB6233]UXR80162.1 HTH domain-containing protein [Staphylococcus sp. IVB6218]
MKKDTRQQKLIELIQEMKHVKADTLAQKLGVSKRTVLRDVQELEAKGVHLQTHAGQKGGYRMQSEMNHNALTFSDNEVQALYLILKESMTQTSLPYDQEIESVIAKLLRHPNVTVRQSLQHMNDTIRFEADQPVRLPRLLHAILVYCHERKVMAIEHHRTDLEQSVVENVVFIGVLCESGVWRAVVYHIGGGYTKTIDIEHIQDVSYSFYKSIKTQDITLDNYQNFLQ